MIIIGRKPAENETVWFWSNDGKSHIQCMIYKRTGWHLGWWSGTRWHSYFDKELNQSSVIGWVPLRLPEIPERTKL